VIDQGRIVFATRSTGGRIHLVRKDGLPFCRAPNVQWASVDHDLRFRIDDEDVCRTCRTAAMGWLRGNTQLRHATEWADAMLKERREAVIADRQEELLGQRSPGHVDYLAHAFGECGDECAWCAALPNPPQRIPYG
jgi:hypothetical protein